MKINLCFLKHLFVNHLYRPLQNIRRMTNKKVSNRLETMRVYLSFQWQYLFLETHSFPQNCFRTKCSPLVMDDLCEPVFWYIFAPNRGWYLCNLAYLIKCIHGKTPINIFTVLTIRRVWMRGCKCQLSVKKFRPFISSQLDSEPFVSFQLNDYYQWLLSDLIFGLMSKGTYSVNSKIKSRINTIRTPFSKFWIEIIPTSSQAKWLSIFVWRVFELVTTLLHTNFCLPVRNIETFLFNHLAGQNVGKKIVRKTAYKLKSSHVIKFHIKIFEAIFTGQLL